MKYFVFYKYILLFRDNHARESVDEIRCNCLRIDQYYRTRGQIQQTEEFNTRYFANDPFKWLFINENPLIKVSLNLFPWSNWQPVIIRSFNGLELNRHFLRSLCFMQQVTSLSSFLPGTRVITILALVCVCKLKKKYEIVIAWHVYTCAQLSISWIKCWCR